MIDPSAAATAFATVVSLVADYRAHRALDQSVDLPGFVEWLATSGHVEIKEMIERNTAISVSIKAMLHEDRRQFFDRFDRIDSMLARLCTGFGAAESLANAMRPGAQLSSGAIDLLVGIEQKACSKLLEHFGQNDVALIALDGVGGQVAISDFRFYRDDVACLVDIGLLRSAGHNKSGERILAPTRRGSEVAQRVVAFRSESK